MTNFQGSPGQWIKDQRESLDLTQRELANEIGCSIITIRKIEAGERRPSKQVARKLAESLRIPVLDLPRFLEFVRPREMLPLPGIYPPNELESLRQEVERLRQEVDWLKLVVRRLESSRD